MYAQGYPQQLKRLRQDLQNLQDLADLCKKREVKKLRQVEVIHDVLTRALFPHLIPCD